jgi:hypothetical protein
MRLGFAGARNGLTFIAMNTCTSSAVHGPRTFITLDSDVLHKSPSVDGHFSQIIEHRSFLFSSQSSILRFVTDLRWYCFRHPPASPGQILKPIHYEMLS